MFKRLAKFTMMIIISSSMATILNALRKPTRSANAPNTNGTTITDRPEPSEIRALALSACWGTVASVSDIARG